jgi:K+-transporting ATPase ATPase C chain
MATRLPGWLRQHLAALSAPARPHRPARPRLPARDHRDRQIPGLKSRADGSIISDGKGAAGSSLIGQAFTDSEGNPLRQYFQSRPSAAGDGYDPTATSASNLGPESIVDVPDNPATKDTDESKPSLLTQVCSRSLAVGRLEGIDGSRPYCTPDGKGAVLAVFHAGPGYTGPVTRVVSLDQPCPDTPFLTAYQRVPVECRSDGEDVSLGQVVAIRGIAPARARPCLPDAVTGPAGSGLDPTDQPGVRGPAGRPGARHAPMPVTRCGSWSGPTTAGRSLGSSASRASTSRRSTWNSTASPVAP